MKSSASLTRFVAALAVVAGPVTLLGWSPDARADVPPSCTGEDSLITCAEADVGKPCQGGGTCYAINCTFDIPNMEATVYKCYACPTTVDAPDAGCLSDSDLGTSCGDGGTCAFIASWCHPKSKYACSIPAAAQPTGPPAGEPDAGSAGGAAGTDAGNVGGMAGSNAGTGGNATGTGGGASGTGGALGGGSKNSSGGGCAVVTGVPTTAGIAVGLIAIGLAFLLLSRRRRTR